MKSILFSILLLFVPKLAISQSSSDDRKIFLDSTWQKTSKANHKYYRIIKGYNSDKQEAYQIYDYYKSGVLEKEGKSKYKSIIYKEGQYTFYYENGNKKSISNFVNDARQGIEIKWYENGNKKEIRENFMVLDKNECEFRIDDYWDSDATQKISNGNGEYIDNNENIVSSGKLKNGFKDGFWQGYDKIAGYTFKENYENQKLLSGVSIESNGEKHKYTVREVQPVPRDGIRDFYKFMGSNFVLPKVQGLKGKIYLSFVVEKDGKIVEPKMLRDIGYGTGQEAIRVLLKYGDWIPGEQRGRKVRFTFNLPVSIQISE